MVDQSKIDSTRNREIGIINYNSDVDSTFNMNQFEVELNSRDFNKKKSEVKF